MFTFRTNPFESLKQSSKSAGSSSFRWGRPVPVPPSSLFPFRRPSTSAEKSYQLIIVVLLVLLLLILLWSKPLPWSARGRAVPPAFVITLAGEDRRLPQIIRLFQRYAQMELIPFYGFHGNAQFGPNGTKKRSRLTPGQRGLKETMKMFFRMVKSKQYDEVMVFQDDAIPHLNFSSLYASLDRRCIDADVLLLGASIWHRKRSLWPQGTCFDADKMTFGAYGLSVKRKAFDPILTWLDEVEQITFDHIYKYLQIDGLTVRVAHPPFLVIMDVSHQSLINNHRSALQFNIDARATLHDWHLNEYPTSILDAPK